MHRSLAFLLLTSFTLFADEKALSETDRQLLLERLEEIKNTSRATVDGRFQVALTAFRKGRASNEAAHDLYLNCVEKVKFEDELRKSSEFRDWKQQHRDKTDTPGFRLALRHQLNWLALTIEAIHADEATGLTTRALGVVEAIVGDAEKLKDQQDVLKTDVLQTVFARAYSVDAASPPDWPTNPVDLDTLYEQLILPPLRNSKSLATLGKTWLKRIEQEGLLLREWTPTATSDDDRNPAYEQWLAEDRQDLLWKMEIDLFRSGDQKQSAVRMLKHIEGNLTHQSAPTWIEQFTTLVEGGQLKTSPIDASAE